MELLKNIKATDEEIEGKVFFSLFDKYIGFFTEGTVDLDYVKKCAEYLNSINEKVIEDLCLASIRYCNEILKLNDEQFIKFENPQDILKLIYPACLIVPYPENDDEPIIHLELNCEWEKEHGLEWIVRDNKVLYVSSYSGEDPWRNFSVNEPGNFALMN